MDDLFRVAITEQRILGDEDAEKLRNALTRALPMRGDTVDWNERPMSKKWFFQRRGMAGLRHLLAELPVPPRAVVYLCRSDSREVVVETFDSIIRAAESFWNEGLSLFIIAGNGRWIAELSTDGYLYFDFSIPDEKDFSGLYGACPL